MIENANANVEFKFREFLQKTFQQTHVTLQMITWDMAIVRDNKGDLLILTYQYNEIYAFITREF